MHGLIACLACFYIGLQGTQGMTYDVIVYYKQNVCSIFDFDSFTLIVFHSVQLLRHA